MLAFDAFVLWKVSGQMPTKGKIIHGLRHAVLNLRLDTLIHEVQPLVGTLRTLLSESSAPDPVLIKHCPECEFETYCRKRVTEKDDLSLLDSLSIKDRTTSYAARSPSSREARDRSSAGPPPNSPKNPRGVSSLIARA